MADQADVEGPPAKRMRGPGDEGWLLPPVPEKPAAPEGSPPVIFPLARNGTPPTFLVHQAAAAAQSAGNAQSAVTERTPLPTSSESNVPDWASDLLPPTSPPSLPLGPGFELILKGPGNPTSEMLAKAAADAAAADPNNRRKGPPKTKLCVYWQQGTCKRLQACPFAHGEEELAKGSELEPRPATKKMDFSGSALETRENSRTFRISSEQAPHFMTDRTKDLLIEVSNASEVQWHRREGAATVYGSSLALAKVEQLLGRVNVHCKWGASEGKIHSILKPERNVQSARIRLSPMMPTLKAFSKRLTVVSNTLTIGTGKTNDLVVTAPNISRAHCFLEFVPEKGAVYAVDTSTNGTFLNGRPLPPKSGGKVLIWHGDELLLADRKSVV